MALLNMLRNTFIYNPENVQFFSVHLSCDDKNGDCEHNCTDSPGGVICSCDEGYELEDNDRGCAGIVSCYVLVKVMRKRAMMGGS